MLEGRKVGGLEGSEGRRVGRVGRSEGRKVGGLERSEGRKVGAFEWSEDWTGRKVGGLEGSEGRKVGGSIYFCKCVKIYHQIALLSAKILTFTFVVRLCEKYGSMDINSMPV